MRIGYARVSSEEGQNPESQIAQLKDAGCERVFVDVASGGQWDRPELHDMIKHLREDDIVIVWKLDRLTRSLKDLLILLERIQEKGAGFQSLTEHIDTTTPAGVMMMQMLGCFAEFERQMIRERTRSGLIEARKQGRIGGRRPTITEAQKKEIARLVLSGEKSGAEVGRLFGIHRSTVSRIASEARMEEEV